MNVLHWTARMIVAAGLAVDVYVHWHLAPGYDTVRGAGAPHISQGQLFRIEAGVALVALALVVFIPRRWTAAIAFLVAGGGVAAVVLYRYMDVGAVGPLPNMYEAAWYPEKTFSAVAEAVAALAALACLAVLTRTRHRSRTR